MIDFTIFRLFLISGILRLLLVAYAYFQDAMMEVKYTDIDYHVFTDAARFMYEGHSPYNRSTYRYSPLIAALLQLNIVFHDSVGKFVFSACDLLIGYLWYCILKDNNNVDKNTNNNNKTEEFFKMDYDHDEIDEKIPHESIRSINDDINAKARHKNTTLLVALSSWLLNPLSLTVSSRGSAESLILLFVILVFYFLKKADETATKNINNTTTTTSTNLTNNKNNNSCKMYFYLILAGVMFGTSIHLKIYPITYTLIFYLNLNAMALLKRERGKINSENYDTKTHANRATSRLFHLLFPSKQCFVFGISSITCLLLFILFFYNKYGWEFLHESYLHHVTRKDHRHNFSPYFYLIYLSSIHPSPSLSLSLIAFLPQVLLSLVIAAKHYKDTIFSCFLQTFVFVMFNKVCTSQYFLWFLVFLPYLVTRIDMSARRSLLLFVLWLMTQGLWLFFAYLLEMRGINIFLYVWMSGLVFLFINTYILCAILTRYRYRQDSIKKIK